MLGDSWVKKVREKPRVHQVIIIDQKNHHWLLPVDSVWGYRTEEGLTYRLQGNDVYEVMQQGPLTIYRTQAWGTTIGDYYYFSLAPTSAIYAVSKRTCQQVFSQDECMLNLLNQLKNDQLSDTDSHGSYELVNVYRYCHSKRPTR